MDDSSPRTSDLYRLLWFSFYFLKITAYCLIAQPSSSASSFLNAVSLLLNFLLLVKEGGEDGPHNRQDPLKRVPMIHISSHSSSVTFH